jgi:hypothetical protein
MSSEMCASNVFSPIFNQLTAEERQYGYFQQNSARAHATNKSMVLCMRQLRTKSSLGQIEQRVHKNNTHTAKAFKNES